MQDVTGGAALAFACASKQQLITWELGLIVSAGHTVLHS
jgi:hypothetical protein